MLGGQSKKQSCKCHQYYLFKEVDNLQGVPPAGGEGETMVTPCQLGW